MCERVLSLALMFLLNSVIGLVILAIMLRLTATIIPNFAMADWSAAFLTAVVVIVGSWLLSFFNGIRPTENAWLLLALSLIFNILSLAVAVLVVPGAYARGGMSVVLAGLCLSFLEWLQSMILPYGHFVAP